MLIQINIPFLDLNKKQYSVGEIIEIKDNQGVPLDKFWRSRIKDSIQDKCISIVEKKETVKKDK